MMEHCSSRTEGRHAIVAGGGVAGLLAARVLADHFDQVTVLERDRFPDTPSARRGAPQARHVHVLLHRGLLALEKLFPGISSELTTAGATLLDGAADFAWLTPEGWAGRFHSGVPMLSCSRDLLEWVVRCRLSACARVKWLDGVDVKGLLTEATGARVTGVSIQSRGSAGGETRLSADLVVDASGRTSRTPEWLTSLGLPAPRETLVDVGLCYASRVYRRPGDVGTIDWQGVLLQPAPPSVKRGGLLLPTEGERWIVTLSGRGGEKPPTDDAGFMAYAGSLRAPTIYQAIANAEPLSAVVGYRATANRVRHYEELDGSPEGLVVIGDAACAFNPVYGQGMTAAALGATLLGDCLLEAPGVRNAGRGLTGVSRRFQQRLARFNVMPWLSATSEDARYLEQEQRASQGWRMRIMHRYIDRLTSRSTQSAAVRQILIEIFNMLRPPAALFLPRLLFAALQPQRAVAYAPTRTAESAP
jgi:2-polyprenyl-6-methoxyphenol hydroxylase-like FAD-dependent oxidoreductase